ncbi:MAG TPA: hypothetical protein VHD85_22430 [Terracidiphilus sp.]|nr:hypothetical protein [Terracidiphilus sp.]
MPDRLPKLVITFPQPNALVGTTPFNVTGTVTAPGMPEPVMINSVTVQVDAQAPIHATLKRISSKQLVEVTFSAAVHITGGQNPHSVTVTVASDSGTVTRSVSVIAGLTFVPVPPAVLIDFSLPQIEGVSLSDIVSRLQPLAGALAKQLSETPVIGKFGAANKILVGPNMLLTSTAQPMLRVGLWILDSNFPRQDLVAATKDFPLAQLTPAAAAACFALAPLLNPPSVGSEASVPPAELDVAGFALSIPTTTLQAILDVLKPDIVSQAASNHFTVKTATVRTSAPATVTTTISGSLPANIPMTATIRETLGVAQRSSTVLSKMPTVVSSSGSTSVGDDLDWFIGFLVPAIGLGLASLFVIADVGIGNVTGKATGILTDYLAALPPWFPFRNSSVPDDLQPLFPFPMAVLNFDSFGCTSNALVAAGSIGMTNRDQSMVAVSLAGASSFPNYSFGIESVYTARLTAFEPDNDRMTWQVSGSPLKHSFSTDPVFQAGSFPAEFPITLKTAPGHYTFTLSATGTETCASDASKTLSGTASKKVSVTVVKNQPPAEPAPKSEPALTASQKE